MRQVQLQRAEVDHRQLVFLVLLHLLVTDAYPRIDFSLAQALQGDLVGQGGTKLFDRDTVTHHTTVQFCHIELVLQGDVLLGLQNGRLFGPHAKLLRMLQLRFAIDQTFQHFTGEDLCFGYGASLLR